LVIINGLENLILVLLQCLIAKIVDLLWIDKAGLIITKYSKVLEMFALMPNFTQQLI